MRIVKYSSFIAAVLLSVVNVCAKPKVIAHRGFWDTPGASQNSIASLVKADSIGCYASECDVWMSADSVVFVNHDPTINGVRIESATSDEIASQKLPNGEYIPTLEQYLRAAKPLSVRLVVELKPHTSRAQEKEAIKKILALVNAYGLDERTDYITFSRDGFHRLVPLAPKCSKVYMLEGSYLPAQVKYEKGAGIDYSLKVLQKHPEWIKEAQAMGLEVNVWTPSSKEHLQWCIDHGVDYITTNDPVLLQSMLK